MNTASTVGAARVPYNVNLDGIYEKLMYLPGYMLPDRINFNEPKSNFIL